MEVFISYTNGKFSGVVYTEGSYDKLDCFREIVDSSSVVFKVPYDGCKTIDVSYSASRSTLRYKAIQRTRIIL